MVCGVGCAAGVWVSWSVGVGCVERGRICPRSMSTGLDLGWI
ncbi:hypothetical protein [Lactobacillus equicursoris]|nr:hypothetical protein [Lactobacillus equicursoris]MDD6386172.1 hypothetical protein [Lactobacillus equicursoris]